MGFERLELAPTCRNEQLFEFLTEILRNERAAFEAQRRFGPGEWQSRRRVSISISGKWRAWIHGPSDAVMHSGKDCCGKQIRVGVCASDAVFNASILRRA